MTENHIKKLAQHNRDEVKSTKNKKPWCRTHLEKFSDRKEAYQRECYIKSRKKRKYIKDLINKEN